MPDLETTIPLTTLVTQQWPLLTPAEQAEVQELMDEGETALVRELVSSTLERRVSAA